MTLRALPAVRWSPASFPRTEGRARTTADQSLLGAHYLRCNGCKGRWFSIRCAIDALDSFVAPRFITTLLVIGVIAGAGALVV